MINVNMIKETAADKKEITTKEIIGEATAEIIEAAVTDEIITKAAAETDKAATAEIITEMVEIETEETAAETGTGGTEVETDRREGIEVAAMPACR